MRSFLIFCLTILSEYAVSQVHNCNNWLSTPTKTSAINVGNLNIPGNQLTIEATILQTRNNPVFNTGDIVSKHMDPTDCNYLLRPGDASITTTNGFFKTPEICKLEDNKVYHIAMVYDGSSLKFYRNGFLMSQVAASGELIQNNFDTRIGYYAYEYWDEQFFGYINDVRIWNVARTQSEIKAYMNAILPAPTTQTGLLAYYTFDNLTNKQGNTAWNGMQVGSAAINQTVPTCDFIADSCEALKKDTIIINDYTEVIDFIVCENKFTIADAMKYNPGDTVLLIQMKGAEADSFNTPNFGKIINYNNAGNYEFNIIKTKSGNTVTLLNSLKRNYDIPLGKVQMIRVPYFEKMDTNAVLTCLPWDGRKGGVLVLNVKSHLSLQADIDVSGKGFRHGAPMHSSVTTLNEQNYYYDRYSNKGAEKGEGISNISADKNYGRGSPANGGGGGNAHNTGGGGGANGGKGGNGGDQWETGKTIIENVGGKGGYALVNNASLNRLFLGGGGGMGQANDNSEFPAGNGGGIIVISSNSLTTNNHLIKANGENAAEAPNSAACKDGMPGGGGGGTAALNIQTAIDFVRVEAKGGKGADHLAQNVLHGPGGGGGGGVIIYPQNGSGDYIPNITGGENGVNVYHNNDPYGATAGQQGLTVESFKGNFDMGQPFVPGIQKIDFTDTIKGCTMVDVAAPSYSNGAEITSWSWDMGDGATMSGQYLIYDYKKYGTFTVTLTTQDANGCISSGTKTVEIKVFTIPPISDTFICEKDSIQLNVVGGVKYRWIPETGLSDPYISNPKASPSENTHYVIVAGNDQGCLTTVGFDLIINKLPDIFITGNASVCHSDTTQLMASGGTSYEWSGSGYISDLHAADPKVYSPDKVVYSVKGTDVNGCSDTASFSVAHFPVPSIDIIGDTAICQATSIQLFASGGASYEWYPSATLTNSYSPTPMASPESNTTYHVNITDQFNCKYVDSIVVTLFDRPAFSTTPDTSICLNASVTLQASGGESYTWGHDMQIDQIGGSTFPVTPNFTTNYWVLIQHEECNLKDTLFTKISVRELPEIIATSSNNIDCSISSSQLHASGGAQYTWYPATDLSDANTPNPIASPTVTTLYTVNAIGLNGCANSDTVSVIVNYIGKKFLALPNAFTPNGDGMNDCFGVQTLSPISDLDFRIFNRFGELIFHTNNPNLCWDGTYKGKPQDADVYVYTVTGTTACATVNLKGTVTLIR